MQALVTFEYDLVVPNGNLNCFKTHDELKFPAVLTRTL